jgi:hypothetical protein
MPAWSAVRVVPVVVGRGDVGRGDVGDVGDVDVGRFTERGTDGRRGGSTSFTSGIRCCGSVWDWASE